MKSKLTLLISIALISTIVGLAHADPILNVQQGYFFGHDIRDKESVVYVLDLSGSMTTQSGSGPSKTGIDLMGETAGGLVSGVFGSSAGDQAERTIKRFNERIEKVKMHLIASLQGLPPNSKFNIVMFRDDVRKYSPTMADTDRETILGTSAFVLTLKAGGSTSMLEAVRTAIDTGGNHILLLTDGLPTSSTPEAVLQMIRQKRATNTFTISTVGVGASEAKSFLSQVADENNGSFLYYE